ncbi:MAG: FAD:protein FMN transferase [Deltaproteobacteria bacterium]|nr:FAD:protein FMN transferase [Deltaproteobacteria bacterium]
MSLPVSLLPLLLVAAAPPPMFERSAPAMGTELVVRIALERRELEPKAAEAFAAALEEARRIEAALSEWRPESPLGRLNANPTAAVELPAEEFALLERSLGWSKATGGAFDPTFASLWGLWRFDPGDEARIPTASVARARAKLIDHRKVVLDPKRHTVRLGRGMKIGLGGIAKGYAVDRIVALLRARGFANLFVKFGGELYLGGTRGDRPWTAGIQDPRDRSRYFASISLENSAFTTSGDYERFLIKDGVRYHHIIDPATGYPARRCRSVTIVAPRAEDADALSTSVFVLGAERGLALIRRLPGVEAVIVTGDGKVVVSDGLKDKIDLGAPTPYTGP